MIIITEWMIQHFIQRLTSTGKRGTKVDVAEMTSAISTITSYDTMLLDTQESATVYSLVRFMCNILSIFPLVPWCMGTTSFDLFHPLNESCPSITIFCHSLPLLAVHLCPFEISLNTVPFNSFHPKGPSKISFLVPK